MNQKILIHSCCAPCSSSVFENLLNKYSNIAGFFYNPNIHPEAEYKRRLEEYVRFAELMNYKIFIQEDPFEIWNDAVKGYENEPERGKRCEICFRLRLEKTAQFALKNDYNLFTTVLSVSPHKNSNLINKIGKETAKKYGIDFLEADFKKQDGYKRGLKLSKKYGLYRQSYCGCKYSTK
ncbi:MAG: epoxyqueuosine reductase QueH [Candidatus Gastranaerophilales bacterium]|nr:epoxyqueuosine reductase QueH [Candidatus Gastranaerophilales bacterium]